ncbi:hypothetical protein WDZ92_27045 [Nostoc sp. NIES-2111]
MLKHRSSLAMMAALALGALASVPATGQQGVPRPRRKPVTTPIRNVNGPDNRTELQREIAEWNAAVERRKAEKKRRRGA